MQRHHVGYVKSIAIPVVIPQKQVKLYENWTNFFRFFNVLIMSMRHS